ncbi:MAG TPA: YfcC family protein, partial [Clostridiales bacterium]|nr:YfcC family protein [Clostridiales bacterium]
VGGALEVYKQTGAIDAGISNLVNQFGAGSKTALLVTLIVVFSAIGGFLGRIEVLIPFVPLVVAVVLALGYDSMTAVAVCTVGTMGGFLAGPTNLYTVGICNSTLQKLGLISQSGDLFPGLGLRIAVWGIITLTS